MHNQLETALLAAAIDGGAPPKTFHGGPHAAVNLSATAQGHPFDGMTVTHWTRD